MFAGIEAAVVIDDEFPVSNTQDVLTTEVGHMEKSPLVNQRL